jgi:hypothetical protein
VYIRAATYFTRKGAGRGQTTLSEYRVNSKTTAGQLKSKTDFRVYLQGLQILCVIYRYL